MSIRKVNVRGIWDCAIAPRLATNPKLRRAVKRSVIRFLKEIGDMHTSKYSIHEMIENFTIHGHTLPMFISDIKPNLKNVRKGTSVFSYSTHKAEGRCFWVVDFMLPIMKEVYPSYNWYIRTNLERHSTVVGYKKGSPNDILIAELLYSYYSTPFLWWWSDPDTSTADWIAILLKGKVGVGNIIRTLASGETNKYMKQHKFVGYKRNMKCL